MTEIIDAILIDDNPWIRDYWLERANDAGISLLAFSSFEDFLDKSDSTASANTPIFLDLLLQQGKLPGVAAAALLKAEGYNQIYASTALSLETLPDDAAELFNGVVGKEPPQWLLGKPSPPPLSTEERKALYENMTPSQRARFQSRLTHYYEAYFQGVASLEAPMAIGEDLATHWLDALYRSVSDGELDQILASCWMEQG